MARVEHLGADLDPHSVAFFRHAIEALRRARVPFLVGGAYAFSWYTGIRERTKDLDLFLRAAHIERALRALAEVGYATELTSPIWIGKAIDGDDRVDLIFGSGNGLADVDDAWFEHASRASILGYRLPLVPVEEMIWSKAFLMERDRFDGADVLHLLRARGRDIDAHRLLDRFGVHWRVLLAHVVLYDYVFPADRNRLPRALRDELVARAAAEAESGVTVVDGRRDVTLCFGTFLSRHQYSHDLEEGLIDARHA
jgi:hypothetical protein